MIIRNKYCTVYPLFDSGTYKGTFAITGDKLNEFELSKDDFEYISIGINAIVTAVIENKIKVTKLKGGKE